MRILHGNTFIHVYGSGGILPYIEDLDILFGKIQNGGAGRRNISNLLDGNIFAVVPGSQGDDVATVFCSRVLVDGNSDGNFTGSAAGLVKMDPGSLGRSGPALSCGEFQILGTFRCSLERELFNLRNDRELLIVEVERDLHVLEGVIHVGVDIVVQQVFVEAGEDQELTHRADEAFVAVKNQRAAFGTEFLVISDHAERGTVVAVLNETADHMPGGALHDRFQTDFGDFLIVILKEHSLVDILIPRILAPDAGCGRSADRRCGEGLAVAVRDFTVAGVVVEESLTGGGTHVHETADSDFPALCCGVGGTFDFNGLVRAVLGIPLFALIRPVVLGVLRNRNEVDHFERVSVVFASGTVGAQAVADVSFPDIQVLDEFLCESLQGEAAAEVFGGDGSGELTFLCILCQRTGNRYDRTVGGECNGFGTAIDDGLVGELAFFVSDLNQILGNGHDVFVHTFAVFRAVRDGDFVFVIAVAVGIRCRIDALEDDVVFLAFADGYQRVGCEIDVIGYLVIGVADLDGCRNRAFFFPCCIDIGSDRNDRVDGYFSLFDIRFLGAAGEEKSTNNHHQKK